MSITKLFIEHLVRVKIIISYMRHKKAARIVHVDHNIRSDEFRQYPMVVIIVQGCQLSRVWRDSHAFDLLLTHFKKITRILTQLYKIENNLLFLIIVRLSVTLLLFSCCRIIRCKLPCWRK